MSLQPLLTVPSMVGPYRAPMLVESDPSVAPGAEAEVGAIATDGVDWWQKVGEANTAWWKLAPGQFPEIVDRQTLGAAAQTITFAGLNGNVDGVYKLRLITVGGHAGGYAAVTFACNGGGLAWVAESSIMAGAYAAVSSFANIGAGVEFSADVTIDARTGRHRTAWGLGIYEDAGIAFPAVIGMFSTDTTTNITSIELNGAGADEFAAGTVAELYRERRIG
jgi:hypothetical protein